MVKKIIVVVLVALVASARAFRASRMGPARMTMKTSSHSKGMSTVGAKVATGLLVAVSTFATPIQSAHAANYGGFGSTYSGVVDPKDAQLNDETKDSEDVKAGKAGLGEILTKVQALKADLEKDNQLDVVSRLQSQLNPAPIRITLNKYNSAFTEDTQRGTDRLIRTILQDITELQREGTMKAGKQRSETKVNAIQKRLSAAEKDLISLSKFMP
jgi:hypothetical protein